MGIKVGDKVRVHGRSGARASWVGVEGVVTSETNVYQIIKVEVTKPADSGVEVGFLANLTEANLDVIPQEFKFDDIKKGDKIRRIFTRASGLKSINEGVAVVLNESVYESTWATLQQEAFVWKSDDKEPHVTLELVEREPHWAHTKPVGSVALDRRFGASTYRKISETEWVHHFLDTDKTHINSVEKFANELRNLDPDKLEWLK